MTEGLAEVTDSSPGPAVSSPFQGRSGNAMKLGKKEQSGDWRKGYEAPLVPEALPWCQDLWKMGRFSFNPSLISPRYSYQEPGDFKF